MRRLARAALVVATAAAVLGLSKGHALRNGYDYTASSRFGWSVTYIALLVVAAYGAGLPDLARSRRSAVGAALGSTAAAAVGVSLFLAVVDSLLLLDDSDADVLDDEPLSLVLGVGRLSVLYQPEPLKMMPAGESSRRAGWPHSTHSRSGSSWKLCRRSKRCPTWHSYS